MRRILLFFTLILCNLLFAQVVSNFDNDLDGWRSEGDGNYYLYDDNGNNTFRCDDDATGDMNRSYAPNKFLGNWSFATNNDSLSVDVYVHSINGGYVSAHNYVFRINGTNGESAEAIIDPQPTIDGWTHYSVNFSESSWVVSNGTLNEVLTNVNSLVVTVEYIHGDEYVLLDNISLSFTPQTLAISPVVKTDFELFGYDGWTFENNNGCEIIDNNGNPGKYCKVDDGTGFTTAVAPPKFLGNWQNLNNSAAIVFDLKNVSYSGSFVNPDFLIRLSGNNIEAVYEFPQNLNLDSHNWQTVFVMINQSNWVVNGGTWNDLLANIEKLELGLKFYSMNEYNGFDNFMISNLAPAADFDVNSVLTVEGDEISFNSTIANYAESVLWNFGDGSTSTEINPSYVYNNPGTYTVSLQATNYFGNTIESKTNYIEVIENNFVFYDLFTAEALNTNWENIRGNWILENQQLKQTRNDYGTYPHGGDFIVTGNSSWTDIKIQAKIMATDNDSFGLVLNYTDENNYYLFDWNSDSNPGQSLIKVVNGTETVLAQNTTTYARNTWFDVSFECLNSNLKVFVNNELIFDLTDTDLETGKAGLWCWACQNTYFDNVFVYKYFDIVENINITKVESGIQITWNTSPYASAYNLYGMNSPNDFENATLIASNLNTGSYIDTINNQFKFYFVKSVN